MEPSPAQAGAWDRDRSPPPPPPPPPQSSAAAAISSPLAVVCSFWKDFDLEKERSGLDEQGLKIAENQETSQKNRRKLAENTRDFKKASSDDKLSLFNSLLKSYQEEVDNLTKRAKFGENAFLNIYQKLYEAPDPYPALASMADQDQKLSELETENRKMKLELEEYRAEAAHLKNQQATIRRLEERNRQLEQQMEEKVREMVEMKQRSMAEDSQKTLEALKDRERSLQDQLRQATESVKNMQKLHESAQSQLFELRTQSEEDRAAKEAEVSLLMDEVERAQARLVSLEREKGDLRSQLQTTNEDASKSSDYLESSDILESSLNAKEKIISELNAELRNIESTLSNQNSMLKVICNQRDRFRARLRETEEELRKLKEKYAMLTVELEKTKADNVQLYGKIRYVQDYSHDKIVSRGPKKYAEDIESGSSDVEAKYKKMYEDDINPFAAFSKKEKDQRYKELGLRDKITLSSGRFLLGNKYARTFIFFYSIGLHLLVFTLLYRMSALSYLHTTPGHDEIILDAGNQTLSHML
ncbi:hypothetical protein PVAP13_9NG134400 [Panicum virgatum]|uniref:Protein CASP n=1 Tax=Panicum virgatum TaxID=38727 RepID=A0A8T0MIB4_PANVG|nr:hypothetical protein PVAP13_9NG134400 [Panicum virgatum]